MAADEESGRPRVSDRPDRKSDAWIIPACKGWIQEGKVYLHMTFTQGERRGVLSMEA